MNLNIKFADGNKLINYEDDTTYYSGCETCDYGSEYINDVRVETTNYNIKAHFNQMYNFAFSTADAIRIFAIGITQMTEDKFVAYLKKEFEDIGNKKFTFEVERKK